MLPEKKELPREGEVAAEEAGAAKRASLPRAACQSQPCHFIITTVNPDGAFKRGQAPCQESSTSHLVKTS